MEEYEKALALAHKVYDSGTEGTVSHALAHGLLQGENMRNVLQAEVARLREAGKAIQNWRSVMPHGDYQVPPGPMAALDAALTQDKEKEENQ